MRCILTIYSVVMVNHCVKKVTLTCWQMFRHIFDTITVVLTDKEWFYWSVKV